MLSRHGRVNMVGGRWAVIDWLNLGRWIIVIGKMGGSLEALIISHLVHLWIFVNNYCFLTFSFQGAQIFHHFCGFIYIAFVPSICGNMLCIAVWTIGENLVAMYLFIELIWNERHFLSRAWFIFSVFGSKESWLSVMVFLFAKLTSNDINTINIFVYTRHSPNIKHMMHSADPTTKLTMVILPIFSYNSIYRFLFN